MPGSLSIQSCEDSCLHFILIPDINPSVRNYMGDSRATNNVSYEKGRNNIIRIQAFIYTHKYTYIHDCNDCSEHADAARHLSQALRRHGTSDDRHLWSNLELVCRLMERDELVRYLYLCFSVFLLVLLFEIITG